MLVEDERVRVITFTGSGPVGWGIRERAPRKRVNLELGNATPVIVEPDADLDEAAAKLAANAFSFAGQSCISVQRIYVRREVRDAFLERFLPQVEALVVGDPADDATDVGPVIDEDSRDRILEWIARVRRRDARRRRHDRGGPDPADRDRRPAARREGLLRGGLRPGLHGHRRRLARRGDRARQRDPLRAPGRDLHRRRPRAPCAPPASSTSAASTVNEAPTFRADQMPYGGVKDSGNTREGPPFAVRELTEERLVVLQL